MRIKHIILPAIALFACGEATKPKDEVESMKQELAKENIPMTVPVTTLPSNWNAVEFTTNYGKITVGLNPATPKAPKTINIKYSFLKIFNIFLYFITIKGNNKTKTKNHL